VDLMGSLSVGGPEGRETSVIRVSGAAPAGVTAAPSRVAVS
jgi:hypothetical protein